MKILKIELQNINSLSGTQPIVIDFESVAFQDVGLFAITGATGAGKTTILDAITIALYQQVPRFNKSSSKGGLTDVVSHDADEAFTRVTFSVKGVTYEAQWNIRLKGKGGKTLGTPIETVRLKNLDNEKILAEKKTDYKNEIEKITQLNYNQFLRSVMLAQGEFAAFLSAPPKDKGKLLEQITGEDIYKRIGEAIGTRRAEEQTRLDAEKSRINTEDLLTDEQLIDLANSQKTHVQLLKALDPKVRQLDKVLRWYEEEKRLNFEKEKLDAISVDLEERKRENEDIAIKLKNHDLAVPFRDQIVEIKRLEKDLEDKRASLPVLNQAFEEAKLAVAEAKSNESQAKEELARTEDIQQKWIPKLEAVVKLDTRIQQATSEKGEYQKQLTQLNASLKELMDKQLSFSKSQQEKTSEKTEVDAFLEEKKVLQTIEPLMPGWDKQLTQRATKWKDLQELEGGLAKEEGELAAKKVTLREREETFAKQKQSIEQLVANHGIIDAEIKGSNLRSMVDKRNALQENQARLKEGKDLLQRHAELNDKIAVLQKSKQDQELILADCGEVIKGLAPQISSAEEALLDAEKIFGLEQRILSAEEERKKLIAGQPCHVCGSETHPFVTSYEPISRSESERKIQSRKEKFSELTAKLQAKEVEFAKVEASTFALSDQLNEALGALDLTKQAFDQLGLGDDQSYLDGVSKGLNEIAISFGELNSDIGKLEQLQEKLTQLNQQLNHQKETAQEQQQNIAVLKEQIQIKTRAAEEANVKSKNLKSEIESIENAIIKSFGAFKLKLPTVEKSEEFLGRIQQKIAEYHQNQKRADELENELSQLKISLANAEENYQKEDSERVKVSVSLDQIEESLRQDVGERITYLPAGVDTNIKRAELQQAVARAKLIVEKSTSELQSLSDQYSRLEEQKISLIKEGEKTKTELLNQETQLAHDLSGSQFASRPEVEQAFLDQMSETEYKSILRKLEDETLQLKTNLEKLKDEQQDLLSKKQFEIGREEAELELEHLNAKKDEYNKELGSIKAKIDGHNQIRARNQKVFEAIEAQQKEVDKWATLLKLTGGSKDAFNTYVQRLTLQRLIHLANQHLLHLNGRYSLQIQPDYSPGEELNFNLVDHYQADEERLVDTSSGGEKFLISLALALGLSDLSSHNVTVGSLFIDEGFGTLDSKTLETVIATLETLQAQGKMIGIISHVENLKERITTQIQVHKRSNGVSEVVIV